MWKTMGSFLHFMFDRRLYLLTANKTRIYTIVNTMLPGDYIAGFVDGEGCFSLRLHKDTKRNRPGSPTYLFWKSEFCIVLRKDDKQILDDIQETLDCGKVTYTGRFARFSVQDKNDLYNKIIPFFKRFTLRAKKKRDFEIWSRAIYLIFNYSYSGRGIAREDKKNNPHFRELEGICNELNQARQPLLPLG